MKTMKQVLAMYQRMQRQIVIDGHVEVVVCKDEAYWMIRIQVVTFTENCEIRTRDYAEWTHYSYQREETERENEKKVAEFKERFGLK